MRYRPRSIVRLMLVGLPVVLAPLIVAIVTAIIQVDRLAVSSHAAMLEAEAATHQSRRLLERLSEMRRPYMQYRVTGDQDFFDIYSDRRERFLDAVRNLSDLPLTEPVREHLRSLSAEEANLAYLIGTNATEFVPDEPSEDAERIWTELIDRARAILSEGSALIEAQANEMTETASELQRMLLMQAMAIIPASILLAFLFVLLINRPMRALGKAIRGLGAGNFTDPIFVHGSRDVEELGEQLDWLRRRIHELEQQKLTFLRHVSHELKTPLTTIREGSGLLAEALADAAPEEAEISRIMNASSLQLQKLIEDLLLFGKMQDTVADLHLVDDVDVAALLMGVVESHSVAVGARQIDVETDFTPVRIRADENRLRIIFDNLLSNAVKYTPQKGRILCSLSVGDGFALIDVEDTGPGVAKSERELIFEPFRQGRALYKSSVKGTGLGLSIAREYAEAHHGFIEALESDSGAHFRVRLPVAGPG